MLTLDAAYVRAALPSRDPEGHKGDFGKVYVLGGSVGYTGAPVFCSRAAVRSGCGLVFLGVPSDIWQVAAVKSDEAMPHPLPSLDGKLCLSAEEDIRRRAAGCDAVAMGCGMGRSEESDGLVRRLLTLEQPLVLDADGINALEWHIDELSRRRGLVTVLTPHEGEFFRVGGDVSRGRESGAAAYAARRGVYLVLKGHRTVTASPEGDVLVNTTGGSGLAKGGSGDVLTGVIASLMAQRAAALRAAAVGVWLHGRAGDLAEQELTAYSVTPEDVVRKLPDAIREILE